MLATPNPETIQSEALKERYQLFIDTLTDHNHLYYIEAKPIISDAEYDQLFSYLQAIEDYFPAIISSISPTQGLVGQLAEGFKKAPHHQPLLSLENSYNAEDLRDWAKRLAKIAEKHGTLNRTYHLEPKFDGISVEFIYKKGRFAQAITRGDGKVGEDITANVKMIPSLPTSIPSTGTLRLRGEIMMPKSQFLKLNHLREQTGQAPFSNTRNAAAGSIKLLDSREVAKRGLIAVIYDQLSGEKVEFSQLGLPVFDLPSRFQRTADIEQVIAWCQDSQIKQFLEKQDFDFDGLVIKVCDIQEKKGDQKPDFPLFSAEPPKQSSPSLRELLGATEHHPRWAIAYKFPAQQVASQVQSVVFQVGRTGIITPVAMIEPIQLSGAMISRVSLHNFDFIDHKNIKKGDFVRVQRSGEVIPYLLGSIKERRNGTEEPIIPPLFCPACGTPITRIDIHYYCTNPSCPAQIKEKIVHFVARDAMDIGGIGDAMIEVLVQQKLLRSVADVYSLSTIQNQILLRKFPHFGEKKISELVAQLEISKKQALRRILNALGIPNVGKKIAQDIAKYLASKQVRSLDELISACLEEDLRSLFGIGEKIIQAVQLFMKTPETVHLLRGLEAHGVVFSAIEENVPIGVTKKGKFSLTGSFPLARSELISQMEQKGYQYEEHPTSSTESMLIGEKPGSKAEKAKKIGIPLVEGREQVRDMFGLQLASPSGLPDSQPAQGGLF